MLRFLRTTILAGTFFGNIFFSGLPKIVEVHTTHTVCKWHRNNTLVVEHLRTLRFLHNCIPNAFRSILWKNGVVEICGTCLFYTLYHFHPPPPLLSTPPVFWHLPCMYDYYTDTNSIDLYLALECDSWKSNDNLLTCSCLMLRFNDPPIVIYLPTNSLLIYAKLLN